MATSQNKFEVQKQQAAAPIMSVNVNGQNVATVNAPPTNMDKKFGTQTVSINNLHATFDSGVKSYALLTPAEKEVWYHRCEGTWNTIVVVMLVLNCIVFLATIITNFAVVCADDPDSVACKIHYWAIATFSFLFCVVLPICCLRRCHKASKFWCPDFCPIPHLTVTTQTDDGANVNIKVDRVV